MREIPRSPSEFYVRFLISAQETVTEQELNASEIIQTLENLGLDGISPSYVRDISKTMPRPKDYQPEVHTHTKSREYLKLYKIHDMWYPNRGVREAKLILSDYFLRDKLDPMLLSSMSHSAVARKLRRHTSIGLTTDGVAAYAHYFWNRKLLSQSQWMDYLSSMSFRNVYVQSLVTSPDMAQRHLPYVMGISGPSQDFNSAEAAARIGQIAYKHALELEHRPATLDNTTALKNCMATIEKSDVIMRRSDVALRDVLKQFQKFRMKLEEVKVVDVQVLTEGNYSKSGEGTDATEEEDF